jgi:hypothetical protein
LSYGLGSIEIFGEVGSIYLNFGLWGAAILPAWLVLRHFGAAKTQTSVVQNLEDKSGVQSASNSAEET